MSSGDLLIWWNFEFWSTNICYFLLSAEKKRVWLVNVFLLVKKRKQIFIIQNSKCQIRKSPDDIPRTYAGEQCAVVISVYLWLWAQNQTVNMIKIFSQQPSKEKYFANAQTKGSVDRNQLKKTLQKRQVRKEKQNYVIKVCRS